MCVEKAGAQLIFKIGSLILSSLLDVLKATAEGEILKSIENFDTDAKDLLEKSMQTTKLSARGYYRIIRVARTIADLESVRTGQNIEKIGKTHVAEALSYRRAAFT